MLGLTLVLCASLLMPTAAPARADGSLHYYYNAHNRVSYPLPYEGGGGSVGRGPYYTYAYSPRCDANGPSANGGADALCGAATTPCLTRGMPRGTLLDYVYRQLPGGPWDQVGTQFLGPGREPTITLDAVLANVREELLRKLVRRTAHINPAAPAKGLVNLPMIMWADAQTETVRLDITEPIPFVVLANASYAWSFGDGGGVAGVGNPYDGTDPLADPGHYGMTHAYDRPGTFRVTLTQSWDVMLVPLGGGGAPPPGLDVDAPDQASFQDVKIDEIAPVIVS